MRDLLLLVIVFGSLIAAIRYPFAGLIIWAWFTLMTPHQLAYGAFGVPINTVIAGVAMISIFLNGAIGQFRPERTTILLALFTVWLFVSQSYSVDPASSAVFFDRFFKMMIFIILCTMLATTRLRIHALLWMLVIAMGFFAVNGALFTVATLGQYRVQGVDNTILADNNHIGLAIATTLPMMLYLRSQAENRYVKMALLFTFCVSILAILGTHSRASFICLMVFGFFFWLRSKYKIAFAAGFMLLVIPAVAFMPSKWTERMGTITNATEDDSFMGRFDSWVIHTQLAVAHPLTGVGLRNGYHEELAATVVSPERAKRARAAHSIYFEVLGGTGVVGFVLYGLVFANAFWSTLRLQAGRKFSEGDQFAWTRDFGRYAQMSLVVFAVGGASASMEMWDGYMLVIAMIGATVRLSQTTVASREIQRRRLSGPRWRMTARGQPRPRSGPDLKDLLGRREAQVGSD